MKKTYIAFAVLSMAALLVSCQNNEFSDDVYIPGKGEIVFRLANGAKTTKSSDSMVKGSILELGTFDGTSLFLEETVTRLDQVAYSPETKGTPAYTENFRTLFGDFKAAAYKTVGSSFESTYFDDGVFEQFGDDLWKRKYADWEENFPLYFFLRAPYNHEGTTAGVGVVSGLTYSTSDGSISFSYTSPATAEEQEDLLFTSRLVDTDEYEDLINSGKGIDVLFHHALTGVKFAIANPDGGYNDDNPHAIRITKVEFSGLVNSGSCVIKPRPENGSYVDDPDGDHSSGGTNKTTYWTLGSTTGSFSQEFGEDDFIEAYEQGTGKSFEKNGEYPESFAAAGNENNVNDGDATKTFWFIPQAMNENVILTVSFTIDDEEQTPVPVEFGKALSSVIWEAGELRTYTLRIDDVNVKIEDDVNIVKDSDFEHNGYKGSTKTNVTITNTGNTKAFIRAAIVGQWLDKNGDPVFGFTDKLYELYLVESWYEDQFVNTDPGTHGTFDGLPGYKGASTSLNGWQLCEDGYYYYTTAVDPNGTTASLFNSYTVGDIPNSQLGGLPVDQTTMHFELEIATQAISAMKMNGVQYTTWKEAWANATGSEPVEK